MPAALILLWSLAVIALTHAALGLVLLSRVPPSSDWGSFATILSFMFALMTILCVIFAWDTLYRNSARAKEDVSFLGLYRLVVPLLFPNILSSWQLYLISECSQYENCRIIKAQVSVGWLSWLNVFLVVCLDIFYYETRATAAILKDRESMNDGDGAGYRLTALGDSEQTSTDRHTTVGERRVGTGP